MRKLIQFIPIIGVIIILLNINNNKDYNLGIPSIILQLISMTLLMTYLIF